MTDKWFIVFDAEGEQLKALESRKEAEDYIQSLQIEELVCP